MSRGLIDAWNHGSVISWINHLPISSVRYYTSVLPKIFFLGKKKKFWVKNNFLGKKNNV